MFDVLLRWPTHDVRAMGGWRPKEGFFAERVEQDPDIILKERQAALL